MPEENKSDSENTVSPNSIESSDDSGGKKVSLPEGLIMLMLNGCADGIDAVTSLTGGIPIIGQTLIIGSFVSGISVWATTEIWLIMKGGMGMRTQSSVILGGLIGMIPGVNILPARTASLLIAIYLLNHPQAANIAGAATGKLPAKLINKPPANQPPEKPQAELQKAA